MIACMIKTQKSKFTNFLFREFDQSDHAAKLKLTPIFVVYRVGHQHPF